MAKSTILLLIGLWGIGVIQGDLRADEKPLAEEPLVVPFLKTGQLADGHAVLDRHLKDKPGDDQARFGLGVVEILQSVEHLGQSLYQHGLSTQGTALGSVPFLRLPVPDNPEPEPIDYDQFRGIVQTFINELATAQETLKEIDDTDVKLRLPVGLVRLDLDGDAVATDEESFWSIFTQLTRRSNKLDDDQKAFPIAFDYADVHWMIGYTHLLRATGEFYLAHDAREFFDFTAHLFFKSVETPYPGLRIEQDNWGIDRFADVVAGFHVFRWEPTEPKRMTAALEHLHAMIAHSRETWKAIRAETDDDREWIPSPQQTSLIPLRVTAERVEAWQSVLDEADAILAGEVLVPHWRVPEGRGINIHRVFTEPTTFDPFMWLHGGAAIPYLEQGVITNQDTWNRLSRTFGGNFLLFSVWFQ